MIRRPSSLDGRFVHHCHDRALGCHSGPPRESPTMTKRLITVLFAVVATLGLVAAPAQAKPAQFGSGELAKPLGWEWGV